MRKATKNDKTWGDIGEDLHGVPYNIMLASVAGRVRIGIGPRFRDCIYLSPRKAKALGTRLLKFAEEGTWRTK